MTTRYSRIRDALQQAFDPLRLEIRDESHLHAGHAGSAAGAGETHYHVMMTSPVFAGQSRVTRARAVHAALSDEFKSGLHALSMDLAAPAEGA